MSLARTAAMMWVLYAAICSSVGWRNSCSWSGWSCVVVRRAAPTSCWSFSSSATSTLLLLLLMLLSWLIRMDLMRESGEMSLIWDDDEDCDDDEVDDDDEFRECDDDDAEESSSDVGGDDVEGTKQAPSETIITTFPLPWGAVKDDDVRILFMIWESLLEILSGLLKKMVSTSPPSTAQWFVVVVLLDDNDGVERRRFRLHTCARVLSIMEWAVAMSRWCCGLAWTVDSKSSPMFYGSMK